ncbi:gamma-glutamylcyclotransferase [Phytobacter sp. AG2a]
MVLNRESLKNGSFLEAFREMPGIEWWSRERIDLSMNETLEGRIKGDPLWIFAYGSLIYNPLFEAQERTHATLDGWHRSFCIRLVIARGSVDFPGRMLALKPGGSCEGIALRLGLEGPEEELRLIWVREMVSGGYRPSWATIRLANGRTVRAIFFAADPDSQLYEEETAPDVITPLIARATGELGSNRDYVLNLDAALSQHHIADAGIEQLARRLRMESL